MSLTAVQNPNQCWFMFALYCHFLFMRPGAGGGFMRWSSVPPNNVGLAFSFFPGRNFVENQKFNQKVVRMSNLKVFPFIFLQQRFLQIVSKVGRSDVRLQGTKYYHVIDRGPITLQTVLTIIVLKHISHLTQTIISCKKQNSLFFCCCGYCHLLLFIISQMSHFNCYV